jgi:hypothetical protein
MPCSPRPGGATRAAAAVTLLAVATLAPLPAPATEALDASRGRWSEIRPPASAPDAASGADLERLESLGYVAGRGSAPDRSGVTLHEESAWPGWNVLTSGHGCEALLLDMDGGVLWRWSREYDEVWPDGPRAGVEDYRKQMWRRARLLPDGGLVVIWESLGIARLDRDSRVVWASPIAAHHDFELLPDGSLLVLTREAHRDHRFPEPILEDFVTRLDPDGHEVSRFSLLEALERSPMRLIREEAGVRSGDLFHTNSLRVLDGSGAAGLPALEAGNLLVSIRRLDTIAIVDPAGPEVVWVDQGDWVRQHDARILPNGNLLFFDNGERASRILERDPVSRTTVWEYRGTEEEPFFSAECGTVQRLANGNTLVSETDAGRAFEVTREGRLVWEYFSPYRAGDGGELVAAVFEMSRVPAGAAWLDLSATP